MAHPRLASSGNIVHKSLMMIHTVSYDSYNLDHKVECLEKLKECKFNRVLIPDFEYTPFEKGIKETVSWFIENYESARK